MGYPGITKTQGRDFNFFTKITVTWDTFGGGSSDGYGPDIVIPFSTQGFMILNEDAAATIQVSYNGSTVHDEINPTIIKGVTYDNRRNCLIWLKLTGGSSCVVSVRAWALP